MLIVILATFLLHIAGTDESGRFGLDSQAFNVTSIVMMAVFGLYAGLMLGVTLQKTWHKHKYKAQGLIGSVIGTASSLVSPLRANSTSQGTGREDSLKRDLQHQESAPRAA